MSEVLVDAIVNTLTAVLPGRPSIALHEPSFGDAERFYVNECLNSGWVSSVGKFVDRFEETLASVTGVKRAVAVVNGTAALHICLKLVGVVPGDEVLIPSLTFVATANAVVYCGALPHFVDVAETSLGMDAGKLDDYLATASELRQGQCYNKYTGRRIAAVVPMHTFGHPVDLDALASVCARYHLVMVEDAAESLGSYYREQHTGSYGKVSAVSFNGNKIVTTGGGGAILTQDETLARMAKHLTTTAKLAHRWAYDHDEIGYNYRLPNLNAALGCGQLEQLTGFVAAKRELAVRYQRAFAEVDGVQIFTEPAYAQSNYWLNVLLLDDAVAAWRDDVLERTHDAGIATRPVWNLLHRLPMFQACPKMDLTVSEHLERRIITLPSSPSLIGDPHDKA